MEVLLTLFLLVQTAIIANTASPRQATTEFGTLTLEGIEKRGTNPHVRGRFSSPEGDGIIFISTPNSLSIMTTKKENLVQVSNSSARVQNSVWDSYWQTDVNEEITYIQLRDRVFAVKNGRTYRFPSSATIETVMGAVKSGDLETSSEIEAIPSDNEKTTVQESVERLAAHPAVRLLEPAAQALGKDLGVTGTENPASLLFYHTTIKLTEARMMNSETKTTSISSYFDNYARIQKYPNCNLRSCPPCKKDECIGLCGRLCNCWIWICGNCCKHDGCLLHDLCCIRHGFYTWRCLFPFGILCNKFRC